MEGLKRCGLSRAGQTGDEQQPVLCRSTGRAPVASADPTAAWPVRYRSCPAHYTAGAQAHGKPNLRRSRGLERRQPEQREAFGRLTRSPRSAPPAFARPSPLPPDRRRRPAARRTPGSSGECPGRAPRAGRPGRGGTSYEPGRRSRCRCSRRRQGARRRSISRRARSDFPAPDGPRNRMPWPSIATVVALIRSMPHRGGVVGRVNGRVVSGARQASAEPPTAGEAALPQDAATHCHRRGVTPRADGR